jgi:hypothetical protein
MEVGSRQKSFKARLERSRSGSAIRPESGEANLTPILLCLERRTVTGLVTCMVQRSELNVLWDAGDEHTYNRVMDQEHVNQDT